MSDTRARGQRGPDLRPRRRRLSPIVAKELEHRLVTLVNAVADVVGELDHRPFREVVVEIATDVDDLADHVDLCRRELGE